MALLPDIKKSLSYSYHRSWVPNLRPVYGLATELQPQSGRLVKTASAGTDVVITTMSQKLDLFDAIFSQNTELTPDAALAEIVIDNPDGLNVQFSTNMNFYSAVAGTLLIEYYDDGVATGITDSIVFGAGYNNAHFGARLAVPDASKVQIYLAVPTPITADSTLVTADSTTHTVDEGSTSVTLKILRASILATKNPLGVDETITGITQTL